MDADGYVARIASRPRERYQSFREYRPFITTNFAGTLHSHETVWDILFSCAFIAATSIARPLPTRAHPPFRSPRPPPFHLAHRPSRGIIHGKAVRFLLFTGILAIRNSRPRAKIIDWTEYTFFVLSKRRRVSIVVRATSILFSK